MVDYITIIGGGLAGSEAAYQIAKRGIKVKLYEMKPDKFTEAHSNKNLAEIVCSNSFKSNLHTNACGLLKEELRKLDSLLIRIADETQIPAGQALAVDRELFSQKVTEELEKNPLIEIIHQEVTEIAISVKGGKLVLLNKDREVVEENLTREDANKIGKDYLASIDFPNMQESYFQTQENIITVNYVYKQGDILVYPDLIKVKIALDNGEILGVETNGYLTDHYDPNRKVIKLSRNIYGNDTISSMAVAAHEVGHAIQDKEGYFFLRLRTFIFPIVSFISRMSWLVILVGFFFEIVNAIYLGIIIVSASVIFELVTLPVEINASKRAIKELNSLNLITGEEDKVKNVLTAAALTYVAGTLAEILQLIRLIGILKDND